MLKKILFYGIIILSLLFCFNLVSAYQIQSQINKIELDKELGKYWSWWQNSPEDAPESNPKCSMYLNRDDLFIFFMNPFETGNTTFDCSDDAIPRGYSIFFPLITSFCSQGDKGLYGLPYEEIRTCALRI